MVAVVQLVEHQVVILGVAGSSPVSHPHVLSRYIVDTMSRVMVDGKAVTVLVNGGCFSAFWWLCFPERFLVVAGYVDDVFCEHFVSFLFGCNDVFVDDDHVYACSGVASADS